MAGGAEGRGVGARVAGGAEGSSVGARVAAGAESVATGDGASAAGGGLDPAEVVGEGSEAEVQAASAMATAPTVVSSHFIDLCRPLEMC